MHYTKDITSKNDTGINTDDWEPWQEEILHDEWMNEQAAMQEEQEELDLEDYLRKHHIDRTYYMRMTGQY